MELIYNLSFFLAFLVIVWGIVGIIHPQLYNKLLKKHANRKTIILLTVALFLSFSVLGALFEPASIKQERAEQERNAQLVAEQESQVQQQEPIVQEENVPEVERVDPRYYWHEVIRVIDGDTVVARVDGNEESIRIIGIDAPESTSNTECYGKESTAKAKEFLNSKWVQLESDESQDNRDKYGRLLRYVWFDNGTDFGRRLTEEGYAYEYTYKVAYQKQQQYKETQEAAKQQSHGLWAKDTCAGQKQKPKPKAQTSTQKPAAQQPKPTYTAPKPQSNSGGVVKKSKTGICHAPGTTYYSRTKYFTPYNSLQACLNSGGRLPKR